MLHHYLAIIIPIIILSCNSIEDEIILDVPALVAKSPMEVVDILGEPDSIYRRTIFGKSYFIQYYNKYGVEVRHYQGRIGGIIVNEPYPLEFEPKTITKFGIDYVEPTNYDSSAMIMWKNIEGFKVINFYLRGVKKPDSIKHSYHIYFNMDTIE